MKKLFLLRKVFANFFQKVNMSNARFVETKFQWKWLDWYKKMFYEYKILSSILYVILFYYEVLKQYGIKEKGSRYS